MRINPPPTWARLVLLPLILGAGACSGDKPIDGDGTTDGQTDDAGATGPECVEDSDCSDWEICDDDACVDGDRNNSVDEAQTLLWDDGVEGILNPAGDVDYFKLVGEGGEFLRLRTVHEFGDAGGDTVLTLRDSAGKVLTSSDDYPTGSSTSSADSTLYAYLPSAGDYYIQVEDQGTYYENGEELGDADYVYTLTVETWGQHTSEPDDGGDPSVELSIDGTGSFYAVGVALEEAGDVDAITITHGLSDVNLWVPGMLDLSGSDAEPSVRLWSSGEELFLQREGMPESYAYYPFAPGDTYTLELYDEDGQGGEDYWFFVFPILYDSGDSYPVETEANDDAASADVLEMTDSTTSSGSTYAVGQATGYIDAEGDEDWFRVAARADAELVVCLSSARGGSLATPDLEVYDATGALIDSSSGSAATVPNAAVEDIVMGSGEYFIRVVEPDPGPTGAGAWYRFVVYTADFEIGTYAEGGFNCPA